MVSNTFENSAKVEIVNSPFLIAVMMSSLNLTSNVVVECFRLKPNFVDLYNLWFSINSTICFRANFLYIFDYIGLWPQKCSGLPIFGIGLILAIFHMFGSVSFWIKLSITVLSGTTIYDATGLNNCIGMLSSLAEQSLRVVFNSSSVSSMLIL